jgi:hypothetical protein
LQACTKYKIWNKLVSVDSKEKVKQFFASVEYDNREQMKHLDAALMYLSRSKADRYGSIFSSSQVTTHPI